MPGYTHTRAAEPITFGHWAAAHAWGLVRDFDRLADARKRVDVLPLGSGALAGASLPLDREAMARDLGFAAVSENALDAVMDRDFAVELAFDCAQLQTHLARLAEDLIHFASPEYAFVRLPEAFTTGSSLMPQKKNPDALELVRGKAARVDGDLLRLLALLKGLPAGYQKDLQEDKEAVFDAVDTALGSVAVTAGVVSGLGLERDAMRRAAAREEMMAAGLAVALAREGMPFRKAHHVVGRSWRVAEGLSLAEGGGRGEAARHLAGGGRPARRPFRPARGGEGQVAPGRDRPEAAKASLAAALARVAGA